MTYHEEAFNQVNAYESGNEEHKASITHELLGGAAAFEAMRLYTKHAEENGEQVEHKHAKELLAAFVGASVDRLVETKGLDFVDREKAKHHAKKEAEALYEEKTGYQF
ncbi:unnamed protein product [Cunninghamella blakesleeana]